MMTNDGQVRRHFVSQFDGLAYKSQMQKHAHVLQNRALAKCFRVAFLAMVKFQVVAAETNAGRWI